MLGRVTGTVFSTVNHPFMDGRTLLVVARRSASGQLGPDYLIAVDTVGAGVGQDVLVLDEGNGARQVLGSPDAPVRSVVVGVVDRVDVESQALPATG